MLQIQLNALNDLMNVRTKELSIDAVTLNPDDAEESAIKIIPVPTERSKTMKYAGYNEYLRKLSPGVLSSYPYAGIVNTNEAAGLADGRRNLLQIKKMVDAQFEKESPLDKIINYYNVLKETGLMKF